MAPLRLLATLVVAFALLQSAIAQAQSQDFSLIVMPDIQNESQYYPQVLDAQTQWIVNSRTALNVQAVLGLGDIVNNGSDPNQWANANTAYQSLDNAGIPYFLTLGNHDYDNVAPAARSAVNFNEWFGPSRYADYPWYGGNYNGSNENFYGVLNINGKNYLILSLEFVPRNQAVTWAASILAANPDKETIVITHSYMYSDGTRIDQCDTQDLNSDNYGDKLWANLISRYGNIDMVLNGHITNANGSRRADLGVAGNLVNQMFSNYQTLPNGGDGWLRILTFHYATDTIQVQTYSPYLNSYKTDPANQFTVPWHAPTITTSTGAISGLVRDVSTCKAIANVQITSGSLSTATDSTGHYSLTVPGGSYSLAATVSGYASWSQTAFVNNGYSTDTNFFLTATPTAPCTLNPASPSVTICSPANNATVTSPVTVTAGSTDANPISVMQLYVDGAQKSTQKGSVLNTTATLTAGTHRLTVQAQDSTGALFKQTIDVTAAASPAPPCTLNTASPSVTICTPANNATVASPVNVTAGTTDTNKVSYVQLYVDGAQNGTQTGCVLNISATLTPGTHKLTVQAKDSAGVIFKQTIDVTVP